MKKTFLFLISLLLCTTFAQATGQKEVYSNESALKGLEETKAYFDLTVGEPKLLLVRMQLVEKTYNQLVAAGIDPGFVIGVRGKASRFFTRESGYVLDIDLPGKEKIELLIEKLHKRGVRIEQCRIAAGFEDIDLHDFLPQVELVANGYLSMIGYQAKGYGLVPMD